MAIPVSSVGALGRTPSAVGRSDAMEVLYGLGGFAPDLRSHGYLPQYEAAERMGVSREELVRLVNCGDLTAVEYRGEVLVRPAVVSRLRVRAD